MEAIIGISGVIIICIALIAIMIAISRWVFRINDIVKRLDSIVNALSVTKGGRDKCPDPKYSSMEEGKEEVKNT